MKILCETQVVNRETQANSSPRAAKATLALGYKTTAKTKENNGEGSKELELVHFTPVNKMGTRYKLRNNIEKMFTKFLQDGKVTISFRQPAENLLIRCDPIQLKCFLQTLKLGLEGKDSLSLKLNIAAATAIPQKSQPQHKMTVLRRSDYPTKGFPKSLKSLTVSGIQMCKVTFDICSLRHLTSLALSNNNITKLPAELGRLSITELFMENNALGELNCWQWLQGKPLQHSLRHLDLSGNKVAYFPPQLVKCEQLVTLKLNDNCITRLPFGVRRLHNLRYLHFASNMLESLPAAFNHMRLDLLDVWGNNFQQQHSRQAPHDAAVVAPDLAATGSALCTVGANASPLWLLAARAVVQHKLSYSPVTLPWLLVDIMSESPQCACGKLCYAPASVLHCGAMATFSNVKNLVFSRDRLIYADIVLCGASCMGRKHMLTDVDQ